MCGNSSMFFLVVDNIACCSSINMGHIRLSSCVCWCLCCCFSCIKKRAHDVANGNHATPPCCCLSEQQKETTTTRLGMPGTVWSYVDEGWETQATGKSRFLRYMQNCTESNRASCNKSSIVVLLYLSNQHTHPHISVHKHTFGSHSM